MDANQIAIAVRHFTDHYEVAARYQFAPSEKVYLSDHADDKDRRCRFCRRGRSEAAFSADAHAIPAFLGNHSVFSNNECNECNGRLARDYEDHLAKWSNYARSLVGVQGRNKPTFKTRDGGRVERNDTGVHIHLPTSNPELVAELRARAAPFEFNLPLEGASQPYVPLRAAMALIKIGCSVCPTRDLSQCDPAIDWLMGRKQAQVSPFHVLEVFTPGVVDDAASEVVLLRRTSGEPIPYFWLVLQFKNFRLQTFIPFCPNDSDWFRIDAEAKLTYVHFPSKFGPNGPFGETTYRYSDWAGTKPVQYSPAVSFQFLGRIQGTSDDGSAASE